MNIVKVVGFSPDRLIFGFMVATAALSAFVSNTATTVLMMPIGLAIIHHVIAEGKKDGLDSEIDFSPENFAFGLNLMLGIAYAASIGGIATLIGAPPNTVLAGVFGSGYVTIPQMVKSGFGLNILGIIITVAITFAIVIPLFGIELGVIPDWATVIK